MKRRHNEENDFGFVQRFIYKLFISVVILTIVVALDFFKVVKVEKIQTTLSNHFNILSIVEAINGEVGFIPIEIDKTSTVSTNDKVIEDENGRLKITQEAKNVETFYPGVVVKIEKENGLYTVLIKGANDLEYEYSGIEQITCHIYQYLNINNSIGTSSYYYLTIYKDKINTTLDNES